MNRMKPQIIAIDGPDGAGKTTQIKLLADYLTKQGLDVHVTRASGGTPIGEELRKASLSMHPRRAETDVYISLAMHTELGYDLQKRKAAGQIVLVDRSPLAVLGYNMGGSQLADEQLALDACRTLLKLWGVDTMIYMDADQTIMDERLRARGGSDYFESQGGDYRQRVKRGYGRGLELLQSETGLVGNLIALDASQSVEATHEQLVRNVAR
jgi:dTMP kinase